VESQLTIRVEKLSAGYGKHPVLFDVEMEVKAGSICALIGRNGSGKTTLMRCINAILKPMKGKVFVMGKDISILERNEIARLISIVPQSSYTVFPFPCIEMILMGGAARLRAWASPGAEEERRAFKVCEEVGLMELAKTSFNQISGGQKQLVMLARAIYQDAPIMLLDEPNSHLDFCNQHKMMALMRQIVKQTGVTALITLHDPNLALNYCDEVVMLREGRVVASGPTMAIMDDHHLREALGDNIRTDATISGSRVVVPRKVAMETSEASDFEDDKHWPNEWHSKQGGMKHALQLL
jgi:iron complex transport system ATP-binding protein